MEEKLDGLYISPTYTQAPLLVKNTLTITQEPCFICGSIIEHNHSDLCLYIRESCAFIIVILLWWLIIYIKVWFVKRNNK